MISSVRIRQIAAMFICMFVVGGCGYRFAATSGNRLAAGQSIWVASIANTSSSMTAQTVIRRALYGESHALRGLHPSDSEASADLRLKGKLVSYSNTAVSYTALDQAKEYRLTISVELELTRKGDKVPLWKGVLQASQDYPVSTDLAQQRNAEEAAFESASRTLAQKFLTAVEQSY
jgi:outer membrane lipopolysaccharide assembly protein LptE/RlpB